MMNKKVFYIIIGWCIIIIALVLYNIFPLLMGKEVLLEIRPVDPRDLLRGDYVTLDFNISHYGKYRLPYRDINVILKTDENNIAEIDFIVPQNSPGKEFKKELYLKGTVTRNRIKYGIESYFVKEKTGREIERKINSSSKSYARVKIAPNGKAKVIGLELNKEFNK